MFDCKRHPFLEDRGSGFIDVLEGTNQFHAPMRQLFQSEVSSTAFERERRFSSCYLAISYVPGLFFTHFVTRLVVTIRACFTRAQVCWDTTYEMDRPLFMSQEEMIFEKSPCSPKSDPFGGLNHVSRGSQQSDEVLAR